MAENGNGNSKWTMWMAGVIASALTGAMFMTGNAVIANDKDSRSRDEKINECVQKSVVEQARTNQEILIALNTIQTDLRYIKSEKCK